MIKHIVVTMCALLSIWAFVHLYNLDKDIHKVEKISQLIKKTQIEVKLSSKELIKSEISKDTSNTNGSNQRAEELKALKDKAGNLTLFKVSPLYKKSCASCHGAIGEGIIGPKLIGKSKESVLQSLNDFKSGAKKNYVMYGLLSNLKSEQLVELSDEISLFQLKLDALNKQE